MDKDFVTAKEFLMMLMPLCSVDAGLTDEEYISYALSKGIVIDYDVQNADKFIERRAAARMAHNVLLKEFGETEIEKWQCSERLVDLYDCHTCVQHIAQMYAKGVMPAKTETTFDNYGYLTRSEADVVIERMKDTSKRVPPPPHETRAVNNISPEEAFSTKNAVFIDVRATEDYEKGHIQGCLNIPLENIKKNPFCVCENRNAPVMLYCRQGYKSGLAAAVLIEAGYTDVYIMPGVEQHKYELVPGLEP